MKNAAQVILMILSLVTAHAAKPADIYTTETQIVDALMLGDSGIIPIERPKAPRSKWIVSSTLRIEVDVTAYSTVENISQEAVSGDVPIWCDLQVGVQTTPTVGGTAQYSLGSFDGSLDGIGTSAGNLAFPVLHQEITIPFANSVPIHVPVGADFGNLVSTGSVVNRRLRVILIDTYQKP